MEKFKISEIETAIRGKRRNIVIEIRGWFYSHTLLYISSKQMYDHLGQTITVVLEINYKSKAMKSIFYW